MSTSHVTTHVLDTGSGKPAAGVAVTLDMLDGDTLGQDRGRRHG